MHIFHIDIPDSIQCYIFIAIFSYCNKLRCTFHVFHPYFQILYYSIQRSDMDLRRTFYSNIVLSGGSTLFKGNTPNSFIELYTSYLDIIEPETL